MTPPYEAALYQSQHKREKLFKLSTYGDGTWVVFEPERLRPLYGQYTSPGESGIPSEQSWSFRFTYDAPIPDFLSSPACAKNPDVSRGYPEALAKLLGADFPGAVRIARSYALVGNQHLTFAAVIPQLLAEAAKLVNERLAKSLSANLSPSSVQVYGRRAARFNFVQKLYTLDVEAIELDPKLTLLRGQQISIGGR